MKEALFYRKLSGLKVKCELCRQHCIIPEGRMGFCNARRNVKGILVSDVYGKLSALAVDPVEKKPLFHFYPGSTAYSLGTCGCNFRCNFCQNAEISQCPQSSYEGGFIRATPESVSSGAANEGCRSVAYTYNEPTINYEFALETAKLASKKGLKNLFVTNGYIEKAPLKKISRFLDAAAIDLKSFDKNFYRKEVCADLDKILETVKLYFKLKIHIEITTLLIPGRTDKKKEINSLTKWVYDNLGGDVPLHFLRFFPHYKMDANVTPESAIISAVKIAKKAGINYAYGGNVSKPELVNTLCPKCSSLLVDRFGAAAKIVGMDKNRCSKCGKAIPLLY